MTESALLTLLLDKPESYFNGTTLKDLNAFLNGYRESLALERDSTLMAFNKWLQNCLGISQDRHWVPIICFFGQGEADTFDLARKMWTKYLKETPSKEHKNVQKVVLSALGKSNLSDLVNHIFARPAMYLGYESVTLMQSFLEGSIFARKCIKSRVDDPLFFDFRDWVVGRFGFGQPEGWGAVIAMVGRSEAASFKLANKLWDEFNKQHS